MPEVSYNFRGIDPPDLTPYALGQEIWAVAPVAAFIA